MTGETNQPNLFNLDLMQPSGHKTIEVDGRKIRIPLRMDGSTHFPARIQIAATMRMHAAQEEAKALLVDVERRKKDEDPYSEKELLDLNFEMNVKRIRRDLELLNDFIGMQGEEPFDIDAMFEIYSIDSLEHLITFSFGSIDLEKLKKEAREAEEKGKKGKPRSRKGSRGA